MATDLLSISACRRGADRALNNLACKLLAPARANVSCAAKYYAGTSPQAKGFASSIGLLPDFNSVARAHRLDASIIELMLEGTYYHFQAKYRSMTVLTLLLALSTCREAATPSWAVDRRAPRWRA